jgi:2-amino-4-hydroxy-6-hydroxymethyldihydropteridine diphosphokinase
LSEGFTVVQAVVAVGGNVGDVGKTLRRVQTLIEQDGSVQNVRSAELYLSVAMGADAGDSFINSAWVFETSLAPLEVLDLLQRVENELGRTRELRWGPRTLDLDLIFYGDEQIDSPRLTVPHPHCWYRQFVLAPVASLVPDLVHPVLELTMWQLLERLVRKPFPVGHAGEPVDGLALERARSEFPCLDLRHIDEECDIESEELSLAFWFGDGESKPKSPFWLHVPTEGEQQFILDVLNAACVDVEPV